MGGGQSDAKLHLSRFVAPEVDATVADDLPGISQNQSQLESRAGLVRRDSRLAGDQPGRVNRPERLPRLEPGDIGERAVSRNGGRILRADSSEAQSQRPPFQCLVGLPTLFASAAELMFRQLRPCRKRVGFGASNPNPESTDRRLLHQHRRWYLRQFRFPRSKQGFQLVQFLRMAKTDVESLAYVSL